MKGKYAVVRTYSAGVHVGTVGELAGEQVVLTDAKRIWNWQGRNTLHEIALRGVDKGSKVSEAVPLILINGVTEVIPTTKEAECNLREAKWAK